MSHRMTDGYLVLSGVCHGPVGVPQRVKPTAVRFNLAEVQHIAE